jgi:hypothetical protein
MSAGVSHRRRIFLRQDADIQALADYYAGR